MNEELKIVINAETANAQKNIKAVSGEVKGLEKSGGSAGKGFGESMKKISTTAKTASLVAIGAIVAVTTALVKLSDSTKEYRQEQAKLNTAFLAMGSSTEQAQKSYGELYRFLGDSGKAVETANHLAKLTTNEKELAEWTTNLQGVYATFGDSLPIESLAESANETARVGKVTGSLADALNWAGANEDAFNASLAQCNTTAEREALIRNTLNDLYSDASQIYEKNNKEILDQNEAQNNLNNTMASLGKSVTPLVTAFSNLANELLTALAPAIEFIGDILTKLVDIISKAVKWVRDFISALTGKKSAETTGDISSNLGSASTGAGNLADNFESANKEAEKLKRTTAGFDELNKIGSTSASTGSSAGGSASGGGGGAVGGVILDSSLTDSLDSASSKVNEFGEKVKEVFNGLKEKAVEYAQLFTPTFDSWKTAFTDLIPVVQESAGNVGASFWTLWEETLLPFGAYLLEDFVPTITNSFSENFAPIFTDVMSFAVKEFAKDFQWMCGQIDLGIKDVITPAMESLKTITTDTFNIIGDEWDNSGKRLLDGFGEFRDGIKEIWENLYNQILKPIWDSLIDAIDNVWKEHIEPLLKNITSFVSKVAELILFLWNNILSPLVNWFISIFAPIITNTWRSIIAIISTVVGIIADVVGGILRALGGLIDFILGVFTLDWKRAWTGIKDFFGGIWDAIWGIVKGCINLIIDGLNQLWSAVYSVVAGIVNGIGGIAGAIGDLLGQDWSFDMPSKPPLIPKLATGGIVNSATVAMIGERGKEAVLPLENNTEWMDKLADKIASRNSSPSRIVLMLDGRELGWANINSINNITAQTGELQLNLV